MKTQETDRNEELRSYLTSGDLRIVHPIRRLLTAFVYIPTQDVQIEKLDLELKRCSQC